MLTALSGGWGWLVGALPPQTRLREEDRSKDIYRMSSLYRIPALLGTTTIINNHDQIPGLE